MKPTLSLSLLFAIFLITGCNPSSEHATDATTEIPTEAEDSSSAETTESPVEPHIERWFDPSTLDTTLTTTNSTVHLEHCEPVEMVEYYLEQHIIDSLQESHNNSHLLAIAVEQFALKTFANRARKDSNGLQLLLDDGSWKRMTINPDTDEADHTLEYFFEGPGFYSIRSQWGEGNDYQLINAKTGESTHMVGRPYFSPDAKYVISVNMDIEAGYSGNGFQLFKNQNGHLTKVAEYNPEAWGPYSAKWTSNNTLVLKCESAEFINGDFGYFDFYAKLSL